MQGAGEAIIDIRQLQHAGCPHVSEIKVYSQNVEGMCEMARIPVRVKFQRSEGGNLVGSARPCGPRSMEYFVIISMSLEIISKLQHLAKHQVCPWDALFPPRRSLA